MLIEWLGDSVDAAQRGSTNEPGGEDPVGDAAVIRSGEPRPWATERATTDGPEKSDEFTRPDAPQWHPASEEGRRIQDPDRANN